MIGILDPASVEADLASGALACPSCATSLRPWGHARLRRVRDLHAPELQLRPRRARCPGCAATHVLLPGTVLPRRADTTAIIGTALAGAAAGHGHRRIAAELARPISTVRRWLRAVRGTHSERLRASALNLLARLDRDAIRGLAPRPNRLAEALDAVAAAALAVRARLAPHAPIWAVMAAVTGWRLLPLPGD
jgi:transposase-like protein